MRIVLLGYMVRGPLAGMTYHHLQYAAGLRKLGHDVLFVEDSGDTEYCCYDPEKHVVGKDPEYGLAYAKRIFDSTGLGNNWAYFDKHKNEWHGPLSGNVLDEIKKADVLINLSLSNTMRDWFMGVPLRAAIDTDPVFTQIRNLTNDDRHALTSAHNRFFTFGENFGKTDCRIPRDGFNWLPTRQPIVPGFWKSEKDNGKWTTIMQWDSYPDRQWNGIHYGMKSRSINTFLHLPSKLPDERLEIALGGASAPSEELLEAGWNIVDSLSVSKDTERYKEYIGSSRGEWSVAKHGYVIAKSGWFSERSACYLAAGKPVILQDTGFSEILPCGKGLFTFNEAKEIIDIIEEINGNYPHHCMAASQVAKTYFDFTHVLNGLLEKL